MTMADVLDELNERMKALGGDWTKCTAVGGFFLYVFGYLAIRFHLGALGVGTDMSIIDERYLFTGARFLTYVIAALMNLILVILLVMPLGWAVWRFVSPINRANICAWFMRQRWFALSGILFSVFMIQCVMRQCFFLNNLLLAQEIPKHPAWLVNLLLHNKYMDLYFSALVAGCLVSLIFLLMVHKANMSIASGILSKRFLIFLVIVQALLLPINYGILIVDKTLPNVATLGGNPLSPGESAWLVWEGANGVTFLVRHSGTKQRSLITLPRSEIKRIEILNYNENIFATLFNP